MTQSNSHERRSALLQVPDVPQFLELRALLLAGAPFTATESGVCSWDREAEIAVATTASVIRPEQVRFPVETVVCPDRWTYNPAVWTEKPATVFGRNEPWTDPVHPAVVRIRDESTLHDWPAEEREELGWLLEQGRPVFGRLLNGRCVSTACAVWCTETLADLGVDTQKEHRGNGFAGEAVGGLLAFLQRRGISPVWGSLNSNSASIRAAIKSGFTQTLTSLWVYERRQG